MSAGSWVACVASVAVGSACCLWAARARIEDSPATEDEIAFADRERSGGERPTPSFLRPILARPPPRETSTDSFFPVTWPDGERREEDREDEAVRALLASKHVRGLQWEEKDLDQVARELRTLTGVSIWITPNVRSEKFDEIKITLGPLDDVNARQVLDFVTEPYDLRWIVRGNVVYIAMRGEFAESIRMRYFDVRDLVGTLLPLDRWGRVLRREGDDIEPAKLTPGELLAALVKRTVDPEAWTVDGAGIEVKNDILIAKAKFGTLEKVDRLIEGIRQDALSRK